MHWIAPQTDLVFLFDAGAWSPHASIQRQIDQRLDFEQNMVFIRSHEALETIPKNMKAGTTMLKSHKSDIW